MRDLKFLSGEDVGQEVLVFEEVSDRFRQIFTFYSYYSIERMYKLCILED